MPTTFAGQAQQAVQLALCAGAAALGDRPVRVAAAAFAAASLLFGVIQDRAAWIDPDHRLLLIDTSLFIALAAILLRWRRTWALLAFALQLLAAMSDFVIIYDHAAAARAWLTVSYALGWLVLVVLFVGALITARSPAHAAAATLR